MNTLKVIIFDDADIEKGVLSPAAKLRSGNVEGIKTEVEGVAWIDAVEFKLQGMERDFAISVGDAFQAQAKDVFDVLVRRFDMEGSEEGLFFTQGSLEAEGGDFPGGGVNPSVIVVMDFVGQDGPALADVSDVVTYAGADEVVLKPAVRALNFSLGLRR